MEFVCLAVLFDLDGVLIDSNAIALRHIRAWAELHHVSFERMVTVGHGRTTTETIRVVAPHLDSESEAHRMESAEADDTDGLVAFDGAARLVAALPDDRWAVATSSSRRTATMRLAHVGLAEPGVLVTAEDVVDGKPAPDVYLLAASRLGVGASDCVVVEDAPAGVASGKAAGARVIGVASTMPPLSLANADVVVPRLRDVSVALRGASVIVRWSRAV